MNNQSKMDGNGEGLLHSMLSALNCGLILINLDDSINKELSYNLVSTFKYKENEPLTLKNLLRLNEKQEKLFQTWFKLVKNRYQEIEWKKIVRLVPKRDLIIEDEVDCQNNKYYSLDFKKILSADNKLQYVLLIAQDETEKQVTNFDIKVQEKKYKHEVSTLLGIANASSEELLDLMEDTNDRLGQLDTLVSEYLEEVKERRARYAEQPHDEQSKEMDKKVDDIYIDTIYRNLHTIKGNSSTYGFDLMATYCHAAEDILELLRQPVTVRQEDSLTTLQQYIIKVEKCIKDIAAKTQLLYGKKEEITIKIPKEKVETIHAMGEQLAKMPHEQKYQLLIEECLTLVWKPLIILTRKYFRMVEKIADNVKKKVILKVENEKYMVPPDCLIDLDDIIGHIIRNCIDHGIESNEERYKLSKPVGQITISLSMDKELRYLSIADNGRGIDTQKVLQRGLEKQIISPENAENITDQEIIDLLFHQGLSTATEVTTISGRGIGMNVVKTALEKLNGTIEIESRWGEGTCFKMKVPYNHSPENKEVPLSSFN